MTQEIINQLQTELKNTKEQMEAVFSSFDAHKQLLNESIQTGLNVRTTLISFQKENQKINGKLATAEKQVAELTKQLADANAKIAELTAVEAPIAAPEVEQAA
jgi:chromosome segregation ATPase